MDLIYYHGVKHIKCQVFEGVLLGSRGAFLCLGGLFQLLLIDGIDILLYDGVEQLICFFDCAEDDCGLPFQFCPLGRVHRLQGHLAGYALALLNSLVQSGKLLQD